MTLIQADWSLYKKIFGYTEHQAYVQSKTMRGHGRGLRLQLRREASGEIKTVGTMILDFKLPEL